MPDLRVISDETSTTPHLPRRGGGSLIRSSPLALASGVVRVFAVVLLVLVSYSGHALAQSDATDAQDEDEAFPRANIDPGASGADDDGDAPSDSRDTVAPADPADLLAPIQSSGEIESIADVEPPPPLPERPVLTLTEARAQLLEHSTRLELTDESIRAAQLLEDQAWTVFYPSVAFNASYTLNDDEVTFSQPNIYAPLLPYLETVFQTTPQLQQFFMDNPDVPDARELAQAESGEAVIQHRHDYRFTLTVTQPLFDYRAWPLLDVAKASVAQAENVREESRYQLEASLLRSYFAAVGARRLIPVSQRNVELARLNFERARDALELGVGLKFEVNRTEVAYASALRNLQTAQLNYRLAVQALASLLERDPDFDVEAPPELDAPISIERVIDSAIASRPELRTAELQTEVKDAQIDEVDARFWPTVQAQGQAWVQRGSAFGGDDLRWAITVSANWLIYDGGFRGAEADQFEVERVQTELQYDLARLDVATEVRQAWLEVQSEVERVAVARSEAELAQENVELTEEARQLEAAVTKDVELAQQQRFLAELALVQAEVQLQAKLYQLYHLAGLEW